MAYYQLEIHHIDVTGGDCTLILVRRSTDGKIVSSILVDAGGVGSGPRKLFAYLSTYYPGLNIDLFIATHYHDDHIRGATFKKVVGKEEQQLLKPRAVMDIGYQPGNCYPPDRTTIDSSLGRNPKYITKYNEFTKAYSKVGGADANRHVLPFIDVRNYNQRGYQGAREPVPMSINDGQTPTGFVMKFLSAKGILYDGTDVISLQKAHNSQKLGVNANDLSISFLIENTATGFTYFSAGDLSGDIDLSEYYNLEGSLLKALNKKVTVAKASHHGSDRNNHRHWTPGQNDFDDSKWNPCPGFLETLRPEVIIVPCNQAKKVPGPNYLQHRLLPYLRTNKGAKAYFINKVHYPNDSKGKKMYEAFEEIIALAATNLIYKKGKYKKHDIVINTTASVVVVSQSERNKTALPLYGGMDSALLQSTDFKGLYKVIVNTRVLREPKNITSGSVPHDLPGHIDEYEDVMEGFEGQAKEIKAVFKQAFSHVDYQTRIADLQSIVDDNFPALSDILAAVTTPQAFNEIETDLQDTLVAEMKGQFDLFYRSEINTYLRNNTVTADETTLVNLLVLNCHQLELNIRLFNKNSKPVNDFVLYFTVNRWDTMSPIDIEHAYHALYLNLFTISREKFPDNRSIQSFLKVYTDRMEEEEEEEKEEE